MSETEGGLIGDIGATNARFALLGPDGRPRAARVCALTDYGSLHDAMEAYLNEFRRDSGRRGRLWPLPRL